MKSISGALKNGLSGALFVSTLISLVFLMVPAFAWASPGDLYVFGADSAVSPDVNVEQNSAAVSGNNVVWMGYFNYNGARKDRVFYRDISDPESQAYMLVPRLDSNTQQSNAVISGDLVVWLESGMSKEIHYTYLGAGCPGACLDNTISLPGLNPWKLAVRGQRIVFQNERAATKNADIYLYDLDTPGLGAQPVTTAPGNQTDPDISDSWVSWADLSGAEPLIHARRLDGSQERVAEGHNIHALGGDSLVFTRGHLGQPDVGVWLLDLRDPASEPVRLSGMEAERPDIDADSSDRVTWDSATPRSAPRQVYVHDLTTGETQQVSSSPNLAFMAFISGEHIIWSDGRDTKRNLYYNRPGDRAKELAERYAPHLYLHHEEYFQPRAVDIMVDGEGTQLRARNGNTRWDDLILEWPDLTLDSLGQYNSEDDRPSHSYGGKYLDMPGSVSDAWAMGQLFSEWLLRRYFVNPYKDLASEPGYPELYYARIAKSPDRDRFTIQYWIPYYFNNFGNYHEGDWEMVQVDLDNNFQPTGAAYSQHTGATKRLWDFMELRDTHPVVYVAKGSHANYFAPGDYIVPVNNLPDQTDHAEKNDREPIHEPLVEVLPDIGADDLASLAGSPFYWLAYQGAWGELLGIEGLDGPQGPAATPEHSATWDDPFAWYDGLCWDGSDTCGEEPPAVSGHAHSPVDIHLYDSQGRHVGRNDSGGIDEEIPGAEYIEIPELHEKTITVHGGDGLDGYRFVLTGTGTGAFDFTVTSADHAHNSSDTVKYISVPVTADTEASVTLDQQQDYTLVVDDDGDGTTDEQRRPDSVVTQAVDLTPPARVTDLAVTNTSSGTAELSFTAPGDDEDAGTARYYDIRYGTEPVTEDNWREAMPLETVPLPQAAGSVETAVATGLSAGTTYYFALKARDETLQSSVLSNLAAGTTTIPELAWSIQGVYWASLNDYCVRQLSIEYRLGNAGTGAAPGATVQATLCAPDTVYTVTALPLVVEDIQPGANSIVTLKYYIPANVDSFTTTTYASCRDDAGREYWFPGPLA